jgi:hypothetical protein
LTNLFVEFLILTAFHNAYLRFSLLQNCANGTVTEQLTPYLFQNLDVNAADSTTLAPGGNLKNIACHAQPEGLCKRSPVDLSPAGRTYFPTLPIAPGDGAF